MAVRKALVIEQAYLHDEDAPTLEDVLVFVGENTIDIAVSGRENVITLEHEDLVAINKAMEEEKKPKSRPTINNFTLNIADGVAVGLAAERVPGLKEALGRAQEEARERVTEPTPEPTWPPDWSTIPEGYDYAAVDKDSLAWAYEQKPFRRATNWWDGIIGGYEIGPVALPPGVTWEQSLCERPKPQQDELAFLGLSWADVPTEYNYVAVDLNGEVWGYLLPPVQTQDGSKPRWYAGGHGNRGKWLKNVPRDSFGDWQESLCIRPGHMTEILGITWADVPAKYNFVAADEDGYIYGFDHRPVMTEDYWWWL